jgi:hypothetical protein
MSNVDYKDAQKSFGFSDELGDKLFVDQSGSDNFLSKLRNEADNLIGSAIKGIGDVFKRDNNKQPMLNSNIAGDAVANNATEGSAKNLFDKNIGNAPEFSFGKSANKLGGGNLADSIPSTIEPLSTASSSPSWLSQNKSNVALAGLQAGTSAISTVQKNKALSGAISDVDKSIDTLRDTKYNISGEFADDTRELGSELSESMQLSALQLLQKSKENNQPVSNLSTGKSAEIARNNRDAINQKLEILFESTSSKAEDMAEAMKSSADSSVQKIETSIEGLEKQKSEMEKAQKMNKWNTAIDIASAGANLVAPGVGGMVAGTALGALKQENEYT